MDIIEASRVNIKRHKREYVSKNGTVFKCVHEDGCYPTLTKMVLGFNPESVIELGTSWGGLTKFFEDNTTGVIHSFDKPNPGRVPNHLLFDGTRVTFVRANVLTYCDLLVRLCRGRKKKLLYCDNGNKVREVNMYAPLLRKGDMLGVHDWPREIYYDHTLLKPAVTKYVTPKDIGELNQTLRQFIPIKHEEYLKMGFSTRFWIKRS